MINFLVSQNQSAIALVCSVEHVEEFVLKFLPYLLITSSLFLAATFVVYAALPRLRNVHGLTVMCHVASKFLLYIGLALSQLHVGAANDTSCIFLGKNMSY